jgi:ubiquinone/menaquinone biosynthesis C-methylase UbiE
MKRLFDLCLSGLVLAVVAFVADPRPVTGQDKSVRPGINQPFENPDVKEFVGKFEVESREVFAQRRALVAACKLKPGMAVADIGAGTGLFTRLFAKEVGDRGKVYAVDIAPKFIQHIEQTCRESGLQNVIGVVCKTDSAGLPERSIDLAFICDTYHHFEFPFKTMASIHRALRPGGRLVLVDFKRIPGVSSEWVLNHVRAGQEIVTKEILSTGFKLVGEPKLLKDNYCLVFEKVEGAVDQAGKGPTADGNKAQELVRRQVPILRTPGVPPLVPLADETVARTLPDYQFFVVRFRQYPVPQLSPAPLKIQNLFAVDKQGKVQHLTDPQGLQAFFRTALGPVRDEAAAKDGAGAWLRLREEFTQDGFFKFAIPPEALKAARSGGPWKASGKLIVTQGGRGELQADLSFTEAGKLDRLVETNTIKPGVRPICQATKLLDPDPLVRRMAEQDLLVMGRAAREYLEQQRAQATPALRQAIDRLWRRIVNEGW